MVKNILITGTSILFASLLLVGCTDSAPPTPLYPAEPSVPRVVEFSVSDYEYGEENFDILTEKVPAVRNITDNSFVLYYSGSGNCQDTVDKITVDKDKDLTIYLEPVQGENGEPVACTMDYRVYASEILLKSAVINPETTVFKIVLPYDNADAVVANKI